MSSDQNARLDAALEYATRGWQTLPIHSSAEARCSCGEGCSRPGKHPRTPHGVKDATVDADIIRSWWAQWPDANVAIATGTASGIIVLDVDGTAGIESLHDLEAQHGVLLDGPRVRTGGGGRHIYLKHPGGVVRNRVGLAPGLDLRADGGYVVAPPSVHVSGGVYAWLTSPEADLPPAPEWLLQLASARRGQDEPAAAQPASTSHTSHEGAAGTTTPYGAAALRDAAERVRTAPEGTRNNTLFTQAAAAFELVAGGEIALDDARRALTAASRACGLPDDEFERTMSSAWDHGMANPRRAGTTAAGSTGPATLGTMNLTDTGNAERYVAEHNQVARYVGAWDRWLIYDGRRWVRDLTRQAEDLAKETIRRIYAEAALAATSQDRARIADWAEDSESRRSRDAMVALARSERLVSMAHEVLDQDPWLLNVLNGTLNLRDGVLLPHRADDYLSKLAPVPYDPDAPCPLWLAFLLRVLDNDGALASFVQRAVGYSLTGSDREHALFFGHGEGANGKSTFLTMLQRLLGDYAIQAAPDLLLAHRGEVHPTGQADLFRARVAVCTEADDGASWAAATVKRLTGGDRIKARRMREDFWEFDPTHKFWVGANYKPVLRRHDPAFWRRIMLIPFDVVIPEAERDKELAAKLAVEASGILAWAVRGCREWQERGLDPPQRVLDAIRAYNVEQDRVARFVEEVCVPRLGARTAVADLARAYAEWCRRQGEDPGGMSFLGDGLDRLGFPRARSHGVRFHEGIVVLEGWEASDGLRVPPGAGHVEGSHRRA
jgi:putative DNA primase/helicase